MRVTFFCRIEDPDGNTIDEDFVFDEGVFDGQDELDRYCKNCGYKVGEVCAYWGDDIGVLTDICYE